MGTNCHASIFFLENLLAIEMKRTHILMIKPVYLGLSLCETEMCRRSKVMLHGYRQFYSKHKNRRH